MVGIQRIEVKRGKGTHHPPGDQGETRISSTATQPLGICFLGGERRGMGVRDLRPGLMGGQEWREQKSGFPLEHHISGACLGSTVLC